VPSEERIYLSPPHMSGREMKFIEDAFKSNWIAPLGPQVDAFEEELAGYLGAKGVLALVSGTAAMHLALKLLQVEPGDKVFCSALTFAASATPIRYLGAEPVFIDSEPYSWNMSPDALSRAFAEAEKEKWMPRAVIVVNLYGQCADLDPIQNLCNSYDIPVIEDAAESLGATYRGRPSGSFGKFAVLSFNGNKIITTSGGGALVADDQEALNRARYLAAQARLPFRHYEHTEVGYNYRMSNILAAIGRAQLEVLSERVRAKRQIFDFYKMVLKGIDGVDFMPEAEYGSSNRWLTVITVNPLFCGITRDEIIEIMERDNIESRPIWKPMQLQPLFAGCRYFEHEPGLSVSEKLFLQGLCLPSGTNLSEQEQKRIVECIKMAFKL
jgi:pyridoxal phosphate-dependent aminotransferase EpsN